MGEGHSQATLRKPAGEARDRRESLRQVAHRMDERRKRNAPVGVPCWKLVEEGRTR
jgi:hypothetical protein